MQDILKNLIKKFVPFAQKQIGFDKPPRLFLRTDLENAKNPLGKTAFYDPEARSVTLYISGRHPKDILRSLGHELVHHKQNCDGEFDGDYEMGPGYAQKDPHLRRMEEDANQRGSMTLRDFEDMLKKENTIYYEHLQKGDKKMSTKDWKNKELTTLLSEAWGFKFNSLQEFEEFNGSGELQAEAEEESLEEGEEEELDEQSKTDSADRGAGRAQGGRRLDEEEDELDEALEEGDDEELDEAAKPDYIDLDKDGDKEESMKKAAADAKKKKHGDDDKKNESVDPLQEAIANLLRKKLRG